MESKLSGNSSPFARTQKEAITKSEKQTEDKSTNVESNLSTPQHKMAKDLPSWDLLPPNTFIKRGGRR